MKHTHWKKHSILILFLLLFISLIGCTSTYRVTDFTSKEQFYEKINKSAKDRFIKVVLTNDSTYNIENGVEIKNDTLYSLGKNIPTQNKKIAASDTLEINYTDGFYPSAIILLKDGEEYQANDIKIYNDSIYFSYNKIFTLEVISSMNHLKNISYKNHWAGITYPSIFGIVLGAGVGTLIGYKITLNTNSQFVWQSFSDFLEEQPAILGLAIGSTIGLITGFIVGWINGYTYIYEINP